MPDIRQMRARDAADLHDCFPDKPVQKFEQYYIDQLTDKRLVFVAYDPATADQPQHIYGYVTLVWESGYTQFWRRNIPEIVDLNVVEDQRNHGIGRQLIAHCERVARDHGYHKLGISVVQGDAATPLYPKLGYEPDGFGKTPDDKQRHLWKSL